MRLYLVRHTESVENKGKVVASNESPLSEKGLVQARILGKKLSMEINFANIYTSPLKRAKETAEIIAFFYPHLKVIEMEEITEKKEASSLIGTIREEIPWKLIIKKRLDPDWKHEDAESFNDIKRRVVLVFNKLEKYQDETNILMVTHSSLIKHIVAYIVLGDKFIPETFYHFSNKLETKNGGITILERKQKYYELEPSWYLTDWMS